MAAYSINLSKEYDAIAEIKDLKNYFRHCCTLIDYEEIGKTLDDLMLRIKGAILDAVRLWAKVMMDNNNAEFIL